MSLPLLALVCATSLLGPAVASASPTAALYGDILAQLRTSSIPVLLPQPIPASLGPIRSIALIDAGRAGYYVGFSARAGCGGGLSCAFFHVAGSPDSRRLRGWERGGRQVRLPDGGRGDFRARDCSGSSCTEASLSFERNGASYELDAKAGADDLGFLERAYQSLRVVR
jgi:hypothetical protein